MVTLVIFHDIISVVIGRQGSYRSSKVTYLVKDYHVSRHLDRHLGRQRSHVIKDNHLGRRRSWHRLSKVSFRSPKVVTSQSLSKISIM